MEILLPRVQLEYKIASLKRLGLRNLAEYRATPWWKWFKEDYYQRHKHAYFCVDCGATHGLEIDHESYEHLGCERDSEVAYRCDACHVKKHLRWNEIARREMDADWKPTTTKKPSPIWRGLLRWIYYMFFW